MSELSVEIETDVSQLVGRTIIAAHREPPSGRDWEQGEQSLKITLDDGTVWDFSGWGYDASGLAIYRTAKEVENAPS